LLFRGYGLTDSARPIHAGLVGCDSLILLDEAHLSAPFVQTLNTVARMRQTQPANDLGAIPSLQVVTMTATPRAEQEATVFRLGEKDLKSPVLARRLAARKLARLETVKTKLVSNNMAPDEQRETEHQNREAIADAAVGFALELAGLAASAAKKKRKTKEEETEAPQAKVIGIVLNRVATAREVFRRLNDRRGAGESPPFDAILLTGRIRPLDRDELLYRRRIKDDEGPGGYFRFMQAGRDVVGDYLGRPLFVVATQTIEAGADLDFDALVTEAAAFDALRQRFGRLDRLGERGISQAIILARTQVYKETEDPVYGGAISATWSQLVDWAGNIAVVDFGLDAMAERLESLSPEKLDKLRSPREPGTELLPAHVDAFCQTSPAPTPDPDVSLFLHGAESRPADVQVVWRADLPGFLSDDKEGQDAIIEAVNRIPPSSPETLSISLSDVRRWLSTLDQKLRSGTTWGDDLADVEGSQQRSTEAYSYRRVLRWCGPQSDWTQVIPANAVRPGDTIVVPARWGGCDEFGWNPQSEKPVEDVADRANLQARHRPALRLTRELLKHWVLCASGEDASQALSIPEPISSWLSGESAETPARMETEDVLKAIRDWGKPPALAWLGGLVEEWLGHGANYYQNFAQTLTSPNHSENGLLLQGRRRWKWDWVKRALGDATFSDADLSSTEDDTSWMIGREVRLEQHVKDVQDKVAKFAKTLRLGDSPRELAAILDLAAKFHDEGKRDHRFQIWMHGGNETKAAECDQPLAKSGMTGRVAIERARRRAGWPKGHRHEAISVRLIESLLKADAQLVSTESERELLLHLVGTHHGHGRPFFPAVRDERPDTIAFEPEATKVTASSNHRLHHLASGWFDRFWRLVRLYGPWDLAFLEAVLRLADQAASAQEQQGEENSKENGQ
jgi:CRISPR-associated endonuclease/helicase Cas3